MTDREHDDGIGRLLERSRPIFTSESDAEPTLSPESVIAYCEDSLPPEEARLFRAAMWRSPDLLREVARMRSVMATSGEVLDSISGEGEIVLALVDLPWLAGAGEEDLRQAAAGRIGADPSSVRLTTGDYDVSVLLIASGEVVVVVERGVGDSPGVLGADVVLERVKAGGRAVTAASAITNGWGRAHIGPRATLPILPADEYFRVRITLPSRTAPDSEA